MALSNTLKWSEIWRNVKKLDIDNNGFIDQTDFENLLRDCFPSKLDGVSLYEFFKRWEASFDETLLNYKPLKTEINTKLQKIVKERKEKI